MYDTKENKDENELYLTPHQSQKLHLTSFSLPVWLNQDHFLQEDVMQEVIKMKTKKTFDHTEISKTS